jgi:hypothetical protein
MGQARNWTQTEIDILYDKYGLITNADLSKKLNRSIQGIKQKAYHLGLIRTQQFITANAAAEIFDVSTGIVLSWIKSDALKARKSTVGVGQFMAWRIDHDDLVKFIQTRYDLFDPYKIDRFNFRYWRNQVDNVLPKDFIPANGRHWSEFEDAYLLNNRAKFTIPELATNLKRTKEAVHGRLVLLRRKGRMMPYKELWQTRKAHGTDTAPRRWTAEEDQYLTGHWGRLREDTANQDAWGSRYTAKEIGEHLGRTVEGCWKRASRLRLINENWNKDQEEKAG